MTNTIAKAAQKFPHSRSLVRVSQRGVLALMLGTVALPVSGVWAQQVLSGAQTTTQSPTVATGSPLVVTTASGFSVNTTGITGGGGKGIDLYSKGGISFTDTNQAAITGFGSGINAVNIDAAGRNGGGGTDLTITTYGAVIAKDSGGYNPDGDGIFADNQYGGDLTISVASVTGNNKGISANTLATTGALTITATGVVYGIIREGIDAYNGGTNLTIDAYKVLGGITANNKGSGALLITASDDVTKQLGDAIYARNEGTALTISATAVTGNAYGIKATNNGSGALSITATDVSGGAGFDGIYADNSGTDLSVTAESVSGGRMGILANNFGAGALSVSTTGAVTGTTDDGIYAYVIGVIGTDLTITAASVAGGSTGINAVSYGTGEVDITATGAVIGTSADGIYAYGLGTDLTISAAAVSGGDEGIQAKNKGTGALSITASDDVIGTGGDGIYAYGKGTSLTISAASVSGKDFGILAKNKGSGPLSITVSGDVSATAANGYGITSSSDLGDTVTINVLSTASVNATYGIVDTSGDAVVTISDGAEVTGLIALSDGNDTLTIGSGVTLSFVTGMSGGFGTDTLNISSGWSGNLDDWDVINADTSGGDFALNGFSLGNRYLSKAGDGTLTLTGGLTLASESGNSMGSTL
jgi:hypothetical protein